MGIPNFAPNLESDLLKPFYEGLADGELRLPADPESGKWLWYPPELVPGRADATLDWRPVSPTGTVYTFTRVERSLLPGDNKSEVPFTVVLVEPDDAKGCRIPGLFVGEEEPCCEMSVKFTPVRTDAGPIVGFKVAR